MNNEKGQLTFLKSAVLLMFIDQFSSKALSTLQKK